MPFALPDPYEDLYPPRGSSTVPGVTYPPKAGTTPAGDYPKVGVSTPPPGGYPPHVGGNVTSPAAPSPLPPDSPPTPAPDVGPAPGGGGAVGPGAMPPPGYPGGYAPPGFGPDPSIAAQQAAQNAWAREAARNAIIAFGSPELANMAGFGLDSQDAAFARQNYLSGNATLARLDKAHDLRRRSIVNQLAAHGILNSGDLGYLEGEEGRAYGNQVYDSRLSLLNYLSQLFQNSATNSNDLRKRLLTDYLNSAPAAGA